MWFWYNLVRSYVHLSQHKDEVQSAFWSPPGLTLVSDNVYGSEGDVE